jgi:MFS family permease
MATKTKSEVNGFVYFAVAVAALGGLLFGYDTGVISGAILFIKIQFSLSATMEEIVVSSVLVGAVTGAVLGGALTGRFGRRGMIILAGIIFTVSAIGTALAPTVACLIAARVMSGVGIGIASFISPMYIAELVPSKVRGSLVAVNMLAITTGIMVAYLVDYAFSGIHGWRYMFGLAGQIVGLAILGAAFHFQQLASFKSYVAIRGAAMSAVTVTNWALNLAVAVTFLTLVGVLGHAGTFWLYGVIAIGAWIFFYLLVPETKGKTLEQIEAHWRAGKRPREL